MEAHQKTQGDDDNTPGNTKDDGEPVEVSLSNTRRAQPGAHAAAEHVGKTTAPSLVQQDQESEQKAGDSQQDLQDDMKNVHDGLSKVGIAGDRAVTD